MTAPELAQAAKFSTLTKAQIFEALIDACRRIDGWPGELDLELAKIIKPHEAWVLQSVSKFNGGAEYLAKFNLGLTLDAATADAANTVWNFIKANPGALRPELLPLVGNNDALLDKVLRYLRQSGRITLGFSGTATTTPIPAPDPVTPSP